MTVSAHFDGRVFVPDEPIDLPVGHRVRVVPEPADGPTPDGMPPEVRDFCAAHGLARSVARLRQLAHEHLTGLSGTDLRIQTDPESGESWVVVEARLAADSPSVLDEYNAVLQRWIESTDPPDRDRVCLTFTLA